MLIFNRFFDIGDKMEKKNNPEQWVYLNNKIAKKSELYGISGWAIFLLIAITVPVILNVTVLMELISSINAIGESTEEFFKENPEYGLLYLVLSIQTLIFAVLSSTLVYLLVTHKESFQRFFIAILVIELTLDVILSIWMANVMNINYSDILKDIESFILYLNGVICLFYVVKSKRINLTTKKRIREKYLDVHILENGNNTEKMYD